MRRGLDLELGAVGFDPRLGQRQDASRRLLIVNPPLTKTAHL
jgi:hypothetical protein